MGDGDVNSNLLIARSTGDAQLDRAVGQWLSWDKDRSDFVCTKCKLVSILEEKVRGLEKRVSTLRCTRENEDFLDRRQEMLLRPQCSEDSEQAQQGQKDCEEVWQHVTSRKRKRSVHAPAMEIQSRRR
ncbi:uncharacterized protein LOC135978811 isoform X2 [Chrysemys picta bellii]|uniref:uncharacterized protein LOC135978811 isoform X2 n=1 Tax=Chrysemys picta bellii TaxID=8478 RepID=UPI0032B11EB5